MPAKIESRMNAHIGHSGVLSPSRVHAADPAAAIISVTGPDATWSATQPRMTRPNMLLVCITANTSPAALSDWPSATTR